MYCKRRNNLFRPSLFSSRSRKTANEKSSKNKWDETPTPKIADPGKTLRSSFVAWLEQVTGDEEEEIWRKKSSNKIISDGATRLFAHLAPGRAPSEHLRDRQDALLAKGQLPQEADPVAFWGTHTNGPSG